jgi:hypothetical protein
MGQTLLIVGCYFNVFFLNYTHVMTDISRLQLE